jgi:streptomycin 6-kinase
MLNTGAASARESCRISGSAAGPTRETAPMAVRLELPPEVRRKAVAVGAAGARWLEGLDALVRDLEVKWGFDVRDVLHGGSGGLVATAVFADGTEAVLKVAIPDGLRGHSDFQRELDVMLLGQGHGYARVLRFDEARRVLMTERLGRSVAALDLPVERQIDVLARTLRQGWVRLGGGPRLRTGAEQAGWLHETIATDWEAQGRPCSERVARTALRFARERREAFDASRAVLVHGDAHPANVLAAHPAGDERGAFKLIDPDGMLSEPAHDLAIPLRDWSLELLAGDAASLGRAWCAQLADAGGADADAIWQWAFVERVSTGLFLLRLGDPLGDRFLAVAERWCDA